MVHCNECGHNGPVKTNSRNEQRCEACYSLNVVPLAPEPAPVEATKPAAEETPVEVPVEAPRKRGKGAAA